LLVCACTNYILQHPLEITNGEKEEKKLHFRSRPKGSIYLIGEQMGPEWLNLDNRSLGRARKRLCLVLLLCVDFHLLEGN